MDHTKAGSPGGAGNDGETENGKRAGAAAPAGEGKGPEAMITGRDFLGACAALLRGGADPHLAGAARRFGGASLADGEDLAARLEGERAFFDLMAGFAAGLQAAEDAAVREWGRMRAAGIQREMLAREGGLKALGRMEACAARHLARGKKSPGRGRPAGACRGASGEAATTGPRTTDY